MKIHLADSSTEELDDAATAADLAKKLKKKLKGPALAAIINGSLRDLATQLHEGDNLEYITFADEAGRKLFWHSSAHILAQAVLRLYPQAKPTIGPPIDNGFFYDFAELNVSEDDFPVIEEEMRKIVRERIAPERIEYSDQKAALKDFAENPFKVEMIENLEEGLSAYRQGDYLDLCTGPHIPHTGLMQAIKLLKTSGAYWRGDAKNEQLTRIYGISYPDKKDLKKYLHILEEAKKRDHRILAKKLNLFSFHEEAAGMPFFHPRGMAVWDELLRLEKELHSELGYFEIKTPVMLSQELWETSGHWDYYRENMYVSEVENRQFAIKPMNCPGCMLYYKNSQYSYRQLPLRLAEIGNVHRHEMSGALSGLFRVRSFHQDDAHIFMKPEDLKSEILGVLHLAERLYGSFGLQYSLELSTRPEKSIGTDEQWEAATTGLKDALDDGKYEYRINEGDGAFYGPKIDIHIQDALSRTWQCGTIQLDMSLPERFDLSYEAADGSRPRPIMIHRAIYGSIERFFGILIEHYAGRFPLWLSPEQVRILSVADRHHDFSASLRHKFHAAGFRAGVDLSGESISKKVRNAQMDQVNYILVTGDKEEETNLISVRTRTGKVFDPMSVEDLIRALSQEYETRAPESLLNAT